MTKRQKEATSTCETASFVLKYLATIPYLLKMIFFTNNSFSVLTFTK
jgi:predicted SPOUT superfamily RNA methylase MTH1